MQNIIKIEQIIGQILLEKGLTVSIAESCTGGLVSSRLTDVPGSSSYIMLNLVTYSNESKIKMLGVDSALIEKDGAVSEAVAISMAQGIKKLANTDIGVGVTGIAGPTGWSAEKPVGLVYIGLAGNGRTEVHKININPKLCRTEIKYQASEQALELLKEFIVFSFV